MDRLRVGVIGVGHVGQHHARLYATMPETQLLGVVDIVPERARLIGERYHAPYSQSFEELLSYQVEAVSVAVPTSAHFAVVQDCLKAGLHVLVEKPMASTLGEAYQLANLAQQTGLVLQVGHVERFNPVVKLFRPFIQQPGFIESHRLSPYQERGIDVDVVLDLMIHDLDLILSFDLGEVKTVEAAGVVVLSENIDFANARIQFDSGCVATCTASRVSTGRLRKLRLFQQNAYISVDYQTRQGVICRRIGSTDGPNTVRKQEIVGGEEEPLKLQLEAFVRSIRDGTRPLVSSQEAMASMSLALQVLDTIRSSWARHGRHDRRDSFYC